MTLVTDLKTAGILTAEDAILLNQKLKGKTLTAQDSLNLLYLYFESKIFTRPTNGGFHIVITPPTDDSVINPDERKGFLQLLQILLDHGVISSAVHQKINIFTNKG